MNKAVSTPHSALSSPSRSLHPAGCIPPAHTLQTSLQRKAVGRTAPGLGAVLRCLSMRCFSWACKCILHIGMMPAGITPKYLSMGWWRLGPEGICALQRMVQRGFQSCLAANAMSHVINMTNGWSQRAGKIATPLWSRRSAVVAGSGGFAATRSSCRRRSIGFMAHGKARRTLNAQWALSLSLQQDCASLGGVSGSTKPPVPPARHATYHSVDQNGLPAPSRWDGQNKGTAGPPDDTAGLPTIGCHAGGNLHDTSSCAQTLHMVMVLNDLFTSLKNQQVLYHWPKQIAIRRCQLTWLIDPALETPQSNDSSVIHYRYISPQNMNMLKHPIMFWHACRKKPMATKTTACQWQLLHAHTKLNYILLKRDIIMAFVSPYPSPSPIPSWNKGKISTHITH